MRPADADQQPVRAGHVGERQRARRLRRRRPAAGRPRPSARTSRRPSHANTKSTAYSGRTAISARMAIARPAEMSSCATSAAHDSMNAAPTMARPNSSGLERMCQLGVAWHEGRSPARRAARRSRWRPWRVVDGRRRDRHEGSSLGLPRNLTEGLVPASGEAPDRGAAVMTTSPFVDYSPSMLAEPSKRTGMWWAGAQNLRVTHGIEAGTMTPLMDWPVLIASLVVILAGAELFTNGIEWIGEGFGLSEGAVGSCSRRSVPRCPRRSCRSWRSCRARTRRRGDRHRRDPGRAVHADHPRHGGDRGDRAGDPRAAGASTDLEIDHRRDPPGPGVRSWCMYTLAVVAGSDPREDPALRARDRAAWWATATTCVVTSSRRARTSMEVEAGGEIKPLYLWSWWGAGAAGTGRRGRSTGARPCPSSRWRSRSRCIVGGARLFIIAVDRSVRTSASHRSRSRCWWHRWPPSCRRSSTAVIWVRRGKDTLALGNMTGAMVFQSSFPVTSDCCSRRGCWRVRR